MVFDLFFICNPCSKSLFRFFRKYLSQFSSNRKFILSVKLNIYVLKITLAISLKNMAEAYPKFIVNKKENNCCVNTLTKGEPSQFSIFDYFKWNFAIMSKFKKWSKFNASFSVFKWSDNGVLFPNCNQKWRRRIRFTEEFKHYLVICSAL